MGSNPIPSIVASVRIPEKKRSQREIEAQLSQGAKILLERGDIVVPNSEKRNHMKDIYNRHKRLSESIERIGSELDESDRTDVLKFVEYMTDNENAILWIIRCSKSPKSCPDRMTHT